MKPPIRILDDENSDPRAAQIPCQYALEWKPLRSPQSWEDAAVSVFVTQKAYIRFCAHAGTDLENEVGGWLLGKYRTDRKTGLPFIIVDTVLPARQVIQGSAFLTFTQESQVALLNYHYDHYASKDILGWFHTHPRMGIFLSEYDTWLHDHFFPDFWQVALVIEPFSRSGGFFIRQKDSLLDARNYYGFYELTGGKGHSVVHWQNLVPWANSHQEGVIDE